MTLDTHEHNDLERHQARVAMRYSEVCALRKGAPGSLMLHNDEKAAWREFVRLADQLLAYYPDADFAGRNEYLDWVDHLDELAERGYQNDLASQNDKEGVNG